MTLTNKVIWITGASSGIGKSLAIELSNYPCKLILSARRKEVLDEVKQLCKNQENIAILPFDLADYQIMPKIADEAVKCFGIVDILINNGGISQRSLIIETSIEVDKKLIAIDYLGTVALTKAILPHFVKNQSGHYVVVSSLMGKFSSPLRSAYCGAKHALHGFFNSLRLEHHKDNVKVILICPGFVNTNVARNALTADGSQQTIQDTMTENGLNPEVFVKKMIKAIKKEKFEAYIGKFESFGVLVQRLSPRLIHWLVLKSKVK